MTTCLGYGVTIAKTHPRLMIPVSADVAQTVGCRYHLMKRIVARIVPRSTK